MWFPETEKFEIWPIYTLSLGILYSKGPWDDVVTLSTDIIALWKALQGALKIIFCDVVRCRSCSFAMGDLQGTKVSHWLNNILL